MASSLKWTPLILKPLAGEVRPLAPISGIRQIRATGFNYQKHIEEVKVPTPTEPEVFQPRGLGRGEAKEAIRTGFRPLPDDMIIS